MIMQWGGSSGSTGDAPNSVITVTLPIVFTGAFRPFVSCTTGYPTHIQVINATQFRYTNATANNGSFWFAIGY